MAHAHSAEYGLQANYLAPDGYRYGVMFHDGSVAERWSGSTQRYQAEVHAQRCAVVFHPDHITLARRRPGEPPWERVIPPGGPDA